MLEEQYMRLAMELAKRGVGKTNPNPLVGAVIVKDERIIGLGYHEYYGGLHAERNALESCKESPEGATLYVTLEPCCHYGKTPPCTEVIIENKLARVVIGSKDPNPLVAGKGVAALKSAGIEVIENYLEKECNELNPVFFHYMKTKKPYIAMKYAMTLDGKIATKAGQSKWITKEEARLHVHQLRNYYSGIMVGIETVLADDPMLNCRLELEKRNPIRIVCDSHLRIPMKSKLIESCKDIPVWIGVLEAMRGGAKAKCLEEKGVKIFYLPEKDGHIFLPDFLEKLGAEGIDGILVEGGSKIHGTLLKERLINHVYAYIAGKLFGSSDYTPIRGGEIKEVTQCLELERPKVSVLGEDILVEYEVKR